MSTNVVTVVGNCVEEPELRFTPQGVAMMRLRVAVNRRVKGRDGEWVNEASFFTGTVWRELAENAAASLHKGVAVVMTGRLEQREWVGKDGAKRSVVEIAVEDLGVSLHAATATVVRQVPKDHTPARDGDGARSSLGREPAPHASRDDDYPPDPW